MLSRRLTLKLAPAFAALAFVSMSLIVRAQTPSLRTFSMEEFSDLRRVKQTSELAPDVLRTLEDFQPANLPAVQRRLLRVTLREEFAHNGKIFRTSTNIIESLRGQPGYYFVKGKGAKPEIGIFLTTSYDIYFLNLWQLAGRDHTDWRHFVGGDSISDTTGYMSQLKLPPRFDDALAPGASWAHEMTYETESSRIQGSETTKSGSLTYVAQECRNGQEAPASDLHPKLSGKMILIQCQSKVPAIGDYVKLAYLKDYGFFMPLNRRHISATPTPVQRTALYSIVDIEFDPIPMKSN